MARLSEHHKTLTNGKGKCSTPMWCGGVPAGFCDNDAFGEQTKEYLAAWRWSQYNQPSYASALACPAHGGPNG